MWNTKTALSALLGLSLAVAACDASPADLTPDAISTFTANINGALTMQISGSAISFGKSPDGWNVQLTSPGDTANILFVTAGTGRPLAGPYSIVDVALDGGNPPPGDYTAVVGLTNTPGGPSSFGSVTGTLDIDASSSTSVVGRFSFSAQDPLDPLRTVTVDGTFTATNQDLP